MQSLFNNLFQMLLALRYQAKFKQLKSFSNKLSKHCCPFINILIYHIISKLR